MDKEIEVLSGQQKTSTQVAVTTEEVSERPRIASLSRHDTDHDDWKTGVMARSQYPQYCYVCNSFAY